MTFQVLIPGKTAYSIKDENNNMSSITIEKWEADLLQLMLENVHEWLQQNFESVCSKMPHLSRREKGNIVREIAHRKAAQHPSYREWISNL